MKKFLVSLSIIVMLFLCSTICFAAENTTINLGNEIKSSIDKTGDSIENVVSGNIVDSTVNTVKDGVNMVGNGVNAEVNMIDNGVNNVKNGTENVANGISNNGNYNTTRTTTEGQVTNSGIGTMNTTTWMWIILIVAAVIIIAAIWYYSTQTNE